MIYSGAEGPHLHFLRADIKSGKWKGIWRQAKFARIKRQSITVSAYDHVGGTIITPFTLQPARGFFLFKKVLT